MLKKSLTDRPMSDAAFIDQAVTWSRDLTRMRTRGPGDIDNAMRAIERDYGIDYWTLWQLRYTRDRIRKIGASIYARLHDAYRAECERQMRKLAHEIHITEQIAGADHPHVVAAKAVVDAAAVAERADAAAAAIGKAAKAVSDEEMEFPAFLKRAK